MQARPARQARVEGRATTTTQTRRTAAPRRHGVRATSNGTRVGSAALSALIPGLGQLANRETRLALWFGAPVLALAAFGWLLLQINTPTRLIATLIVPTTLSAVLVLNGLVLLWRLASVGQAFLDRRHRGPASARGWIALVAIMAFVGVPHGIGHSVGLATLDTFDAIFEGPAAGPEALPPGPGSTERLNVLLLGVDSGPGRDHALTDSMIVASLDPVGETVTMVSIPRDLVMVPLGNGDNYGPKINSLRSYADQHPEEFPEGGIRALENAISALLGIEIHYHAEVDLLGFVKMVDAVGGVDVNVARPISDPTYGGLGVGPGGWSITAGRHHLDGANALAYARVRKADGENDFTRAGRQQQVLIAIRNAAVRGENLLFRLPALIDAVGDTVSTNLPPDRLPALAAMAEEIDGKRTVRIVIRAPLVSPGNNRYGSVQIPDVPAIQAVAAKAFPEPGVPPQPWPPRPSAAPSGAPAP